MNHAEIAKKYAHDVVEGKVPACQHVQNACQRHLDDLKDEDSLYVFDSQIANRACRFIEKLPHTKGKWAHKREPIRLEPWQVFIVASIFGWIRKDNGFRRYREAYIEVGRKNGKSIIAAGIGLYMFAADGEYGAEVYSGATTEKQAWEVFRPARLMAKKTPGLCEALGIQVNASNLLKLEDGSRFEPLIGNPGDGSSPSCAIVDEYHEHSTSDLYDTMITGMGARDQPLMLIITTAGSNIAGPCYDKRDQAIKVLNKSIENPELFAIIYTIDEGTESRPVDDWTDIESIKKANPNFGVSVGEEYLHSQLRNAMQSARRQSIFKTKHLNIWVAAMNAWMNMQAWGKAPKRKSLEELAGRSCYIGIDLASKVDIAAALVVFPPEGDDPRYHLHGRYYLPEEMVLEQATSNHSHYDGWAKQGLIELTPGNVIDYEYIMDDLRDFLSRFDVVEIPYDPWQAMQFAVQMQAEGAPMVEVRATVQNFSEPMKELEALVLSKKLAHGHCPVLTWMASNVVSKLDKKDNIYPNKEKSENKIDGIVALIMAIGRIFAGVEEVDPYAKRGLRTL